MSGFHRDPEPSCTGPIHISFHKSGQRTCIGVQKLNCLIAEQGCISQAMSGDLKSPVGVDMDNAPSKRLWDHKDPSSTKTFAFKNHVETKFHVTFKDYEQLRQWSITNINKFWEEVWHFAGIKASNAFIKVISKALLHISC